MHIIYYKIIKVDDRLQFSFSMKYYEGIKGLLDDKFYFLHSKEVQKKHKKKLILFYQDENGHHIQLVKNSPFQFKGYFILQDMKSLPKQISVINNIVTLSIREFAYDLIPHNVNELLLLKEVVNHKLVLIHSRVDSYDLYSSNPSLLYGSTGYQGKDGNIYAGSKGLKVYVKKDRCRVEINLNRSYLRNHTSKSYDVSEFITIRNDLNEEKLCKTLFKMSQLRDRHFSNYQRTCGLRERVIESLSSSICYEGGQLLTISDQISNFKKCFTGTRLASRINEFFPLTGESLFDGKISYPENFI